MAAAWLAHAGLAIAQASEPDAATPVEDKTSSVAEDGAADEAGGADEPWAARYTAATLPRRASLADLEARFGFAFGMARERGELPRLGGAAAFFPDAGRIGIGATLAFGPSLRVANPSLLGRFSETATNLFCELRTNPARSLRAAAAAGAGLQITALRGELPYRGRSVNDARLASLAYLELRADWRLASELYVGAHFGAAWLMHAQRYFAAGTQVFELARMSFTAGLAVGVSLLE